MEFSTAKARSKVANQLILSYVLLGFGVLGLLINVARTGVPASFEHIGDLFHYLVMIGVGAMLLVTSKRKINTLRSYSLTLSDAGLQYSSPEQSCNLTASAPSKSAVLGVNTLTVETQAGEQLKLDLQPFTLSADDKEAIKKVLNALAANNGA